MKNVYVEAKIHDESRLCRLRNEIYDNIGGQYYYRKKSPHITLVPPFYIDEDDICGLEEYIENTDIVGTEVRTQHLKVWESLDRPKHFMLDVDCDIDNEVRDLVEHVNELRSHLGDMPVPYHITLFSRAGMWESAPDVLKHSIQESIADFNGIGNTEISDVRVTRRR